MKFKLSLIICLLFSSVIYAQFYPSKELKPLFQIVQLDTAILSSDNKLFVDCTPKKDVKEILKEFESIDVNNKKQINDFILRNFTIPARNLESTFTTDTTLNISQHLNKLWQILKRDKNKIKKNSSLLPLPYPYIVPGGRFREIYYWDSYFSMLGLQVSGEIELIENMVDNFAHLIDEYGFIPNGNRSYYLSRSQPPFFSLMVELLAEIKGDTIISNYLPQLMKEYSFWMKVSSVELLNNSFSNHVVMPDTKTKLNRYWDYSPTPRAESYREDLQEYKQSTRDSIEFFRNIRAACESGWDFSSRWLKDGHNLHSINTTEIIPVDLNCLLYHLEKSIAKGLKFKSDENGANEFEMLAKKRKEAIIKYCWSNKYGFFMDYNFIQKKHTKVLSLAGMYPLFFKIATDKQARSISEKINKHFLFPGGLVSTLSLTGQQWDAPNGWAPLQYISIVGLQNYNQHKLANTIKQRWLRVNKNVFLRTGKMMEKYDVINPNKDAGGGEYPTQDGFGWTNGVFLKLSAKE